MNFKLKHALVDHNEPAYKVAIKMGISEVRLSKIIIGLLEPKTTEREALVTILGKSENELFSDN